MTAGRKQVDFTETLNPTNITVKIDNSTIVWSDVVRGAAATMLDKAVTWSADDTVALAADGDHVVGKLIQVFKDNFAVVQVRGAAELPGGDSATLTRGRPIVGALGAASAKGYIRDALAPTGTYSQTQATEALKARGRVMQTAVATAIVVDLG